MDVTIRNDGLNYPIATVEQGYILTPPASWYDYDVVPVEYVDLIGVLRAKAAQDWEIICVTPHDTRMLLTVRRLSARYR